MIIFDRDAPNAAFRVVASLKIAPKRLKRLPAREPHASGRPGVLGARGLGFADTIKFTVMLVDMRKWAECNAVYVEYFDPDRLPARSASGASGLALAGKSKVECVDYWPRERRGAIVNGRPTRRLFRSHEVNQRSAVVIGAQAKA
jgi:enamine deaminase RidA (YjgF/YER057c/UK114 family)